MKIENDNDPVAKAAMGTETDGEINIISNEVSDLLMTIAIKGERERHAKDRDDYFESIAKYGYEKEIVKELFRMGITIVPWHDYFFWYDGIDKYCDKVYERKYELLRKTRKLTSKLNERISEMKAPCKIVAQYYEDESVSLLICPRSPNFASELYKSGECDGLIVYSEIHNIDANELFPKDFLRYINGEIALKRLQEVILDFTLTGNPTYERLEERESRPLIWEEDIDIPDEDGYVGAKDAPSTSKD